jgi:hypothetical protein
MKKNLIKKESSNYEIEIIFTQEEKDKAKEAIIRHFGKDVKIP